MIRVERRRKAVDGLFSTLISSLLGDVRELFREAVEGALSRILAFLLASAFFVTAAVFLLIAGVAGLREASLPSWSAYLIVGGIAGLTGALLLRRPRD